MTTPMSHDQEHAIAEIQRKVRAMLEERSILIGHSSQVSPSEYWSDFCGYFDYLIDLAPHAFSKLRLHTFHLTGDHYQNYYFGNPASFLDYFGRWLEVDDLPKRHVLSEPDDGIGFRLNDGRFVNADIARFQRSVTTLSKHGVLDDLNRAGTEIRVVEIGGGYGGFALHLGRMIDRCRYYLIDLPETLIFSAAYLTLKAPEKRLYLYDPVDAGRHEPGALSAYDYILLPDYCFDLIATETFDLAINIASMQEMRKDQVERYLDFLRSTCRGVFYSCNRDRQVRNDELPGLFSLLRTRFDLIEVRQPEGRTLAWRPLLRRKLLGSLRRLARVVGLIESGSDGPSPEPFPFVEHLGRALPIRDSTHRASDPSIVSPGAT